MTPIQRMRKRGYITIIDALIALAFFSFIFATLISVYEPTVSKGSSTSFKDIHYISEDALDVLNKVGVLDEVGTEWASANGSTNSSYWYNAANISRSYLDKMIPDRYGYKVVIDETNVIYHSDTDDVSGRPREKDADTTTHSSRLLVGYGKGLPTRGQVARAFLTNIREKVTSTYAYFGGFEGQGNITKYITLPECSVNHSYIELNAGGRFELWINSIQVTSMYDDITKSTISSPFTPSGGGMNANIKAYIDGSHFSPGKNKIELIFKENDLADQYVGGGFIKVAYNTSEMDIARDTGSTQYDFPGIYGLINLYSSFYVPGTIDSMEINLKYFNNYTTYLTIGDKEVWSSPGSGQNQSYKLIDDNLSISQNGLLDYGALSMNTVPIRMGIRDVTSMGLVSGNADIILITDLSGSMAQCVSNNSDCNSPNRRIDLAKVLDKQFIDNVTANISNSTGLRIGLVGFSTSANSYEDLTTDYTYLKTKINGYSANGGTCICCAINRAYQLLNQPVTFETPLNPYVESAHNYANNYDYNWTISGPSNALRMRIHFTTITLERTTDSVYIYDENNTLRQTYTRSNDGSDIWSPWIDGGSVKVELKTDSSRTAYGFRIDRYQYEPKDSGDRRKFIIVMTDGVAGYSCATNCMGTSTSGTYQCGGYTGCCNANPVTGTGCAPPNPSDEYGGDCWYSTSWNCHAPNIYYTNGSYCCNSNYCQDNCKCQCAMSNANYSSCRAHNNLNATVYSVGFGPVANCANGAWTLQAIANCGNGTYYASANASELAHIYENISETIRNLTLVPSTNQTMSVVGTGNLIPSIVYDSSIRFTYSSPSVNVSYGEISLGQDTGPFNSVNNCTGVIYTIANARIVEARVTSYSAEHWTDNLVVNNSLGPNSVYSLRNGEWGDDYKRIGDPYAVEVPDPVINLKSAEDNFLTIRTGDNPTEDTGCSPDNRAIYTIMLRGRANYGNVFSEKDGCEWTIQFEDGTNITEKIPEDYNGTKQCAYTQYNISYDQNDAIDDAIYRLLQGLDSNGNNKTDIKFDSDMIEFDFSRSGGVQSLWGPISVKLIVWDRKIR